MSEPTRIPLVDLASARDQVDDEVRAGFERILRATAFIGGPEVAAFERAYAEFGRVHHCVGVANGTDALELALRAVGVGPGEEAVLPANTFVATAEAVARTGARPVFVDCDERTALLDVAAAASAVGRNTRAVLPVHLYGQLAPMEQLRAALAGAEVAIVEDAAQCQGAARLGHRPGNGGVAATSFYPGKNLGAYGDAGAVLTDDPAIEATVRTLANHGGRTKYDHELVGCNSRLDALQAVVLSAKLSRLTEWNSARRAAAARYHELLAGRDLVECPTTLEGNEHVWHLYVVKVGDPASGSGMRNMALEKLNAEGIGAGVHYPVALHRTKAFEHLGYRRGAFPNAEDAADRVLSLPLYPNITAGQQERVVETLLAAVG